MTTDIATFTSKIINNVEKVIIGKREQIELLLVAMLCQGHVLLEDVPGTGKTMLARSLAISLGIDFKRLQCTPDLLPNDITGVSIFLQHEGRFEFRPGPLFVNILLADEINRATPRTQSALLEAMQECQVTLDGQTRVLPRPFLVLATQNPIEFEGTFPLPEAQLDRFMLCLSLGYPELDDEAQVLLNLRKQHPIETIGRWWMAPRCWNCERQSRMCTSTSPCSTIFCPLSTQRAPIQKLPWEPAREAPWRCIRPHRRWLRCVVATMRSRMTSRPWCR